MSSSRQRLQAAVLIATILVNVCMASCNLPVLPTDLDLITSVEATHQREVHLHGMYRIGLDTFNAAARVQEHNITLLYSEEYEFRASVESHDAFVLDVLLYKATGEMIKCSMNGGRGVERNVFARLTANVKYVLVVRYNLQWSWGSSSCPSVMLELAAQPITNAPNFKEVCYSAGAPRIPNVTPVEKDDYYFEYVTPPTEPNFVPLTNDDTSGSSMSQDHMYVVGSYPITVPHIAGRSQKWKLSAKLQARFLDGGDLALIVTDGSLKQPPTLNACANSTDLCFSGTRAMRNHYILQTILWSNMDLSKDATYTLWVVRRATPTGFNRKCAPVSFHITFFPLKEQETFVTCNIDPLPKSFNTPGLYDNLTGVMSFSQSILVNLSTRVQEVRFQPTVSGKSLLRAHLGAHDELDIDLILLASPLHPEVPTLPGQSSFYTIATSMAISGPEGIVVPVDDQHEYILRVSIPYPFRQYNGKDHDYYEFCDDYQLSVHVFPESLSTAAGLPQTCSNRPPNFFSMQETLNATNKFEFGMPGLKVYSFTYGINMSHKADQEEIFRLRFYIPIDGLMLSVITSTDVFSGAVEMQLFDEDVRGDPEYSERRAVGTSIVKDLEEGWYTLVFLTPYIQPTAHTFQDIFTKNFPSCIRYNLFIRIQPKNSCLSALQLPEEYPTSLTSHRHVQDDYEIPINGQHFMSIEPTYDALLHLLLAASDIPARVFLFSGNATAIQDFDDLTMNTNIIARGASVFGEATDTKSELVAKLNSGSAYTLVYDFTFSSDWDGTYYCSTFSMEMSLSRLAALTDNEMDGCNNAPEMQEEGDLGVLTLPYAMGPTVFALHPKGEHASSVHAPMRAWSYAFTVKQKASLRVNIEYDFAHHAFGMMFCSCDQKTGDCDHCVEAFGYYNGLEIPTTEIAAGTYIIYIQPWSKGVASTNPADDVYINFCTYAMLQVLVAPVVAALPQASALCPNMMQYLPASLNNVAFLSPYYNDEMHLFQNVLISQQHLGDQTTLVLKEPSLLRVMSPSGGTELSLRVTSDTDSTYHRYLNSANAALYLELQPGSYTVQIHFFLPTNTFHNQPCMSVPLEISVMTTEDIAAVSVATAVCDASVPFPTTPFFHGHTTLYRKPHDAFNKVISFSIGELGGTAEFDIRYNFETSGLQVRLVGELSSADGLVTQKVFPWEFYADRAYLSTSLQHGHYKLQINDPAQQNGMYNGNVTVASCIPYSVHLRSQDYGNYSHFTPVPTTAVPVGQPTNAPELQCPFQHVDPFPTRFSRDVDDKTFAYSSDALAIPYESGKRVQVNIGQRQAQMMLARHVINIRAPVTQVFRLWIRSTAKVFMQARLYDNAATQEDDNAAAGGADGSLMSSTSWGYHTQTLYFPVHKLSTNDDDSEDVSTAEMRLEILFYYKNAPQYNTDYYNCNEKKRLTTFELYTSLFSEQDAIMGSQCNSTLTAMTSKERLPPKSTTLGAGMTLVSGTYFVSQDERVHRGNGNGHKHGTLPSRPSYAPSNDPAWTFGEHALREAHREQHALAAGDIPGVSDEVKAEVDEVFNATFVVPSGARGVRIMSHVKYPLNFINLRTALYGDNQSTALDEGLGSPMVASDGMYQAASLIQLTAKSLGPGTYTVVFMVDNAVPIGRRQVFCLPFDWSLRITADVYPGAAPTPLPPPGPTPAPKPKLLDIYPTNEHGLDRTDPLSITFVLSEDARMSLDHSRPFGVLQRDDNGEQVSPSAMYFSDTDRLVILFAVKDLDWGVSYHLVLDAVGVATPSGQTYDISSFTGGQPMTYSTATCGCVGGFCAPGGACSCVERGGETCSTCTRGYALGARAKTVGVGALAAHVRICEEISTTVAPTAAPSRPTPVPALRTPSPQPPKGPTPAPPAPTEGATDEQQPTLQPLEQQPPLRTLRVVLAYGALLVVVVYSLSFVFKYRRRARDSLLARNPFQRNGSSSGSDAGRHRFGAIQEDDDDDDDTHNLPSVR